MSQCILYWFQCLALHSYHTQYLYSNNVANRRRPKSSPTDKNRTQEAGTMTKSKKRTLVETYISPSYPSPYIHLHCLAASCISVQICLDVVYNCVSIWMCRVYHAHCLHSNSVAKRRRPKSSGSRSTKKHKREASKQRNSKRQRGKSNKKGTDSKKPRQD